MSYDIADAIRSGIADIGIVADSVDLQGLETHTFRPDPLTLSVPTNHQLAQRHSISLAEVAHHDFVALTEGSALKAQLAHHARKAGKPLGYRVLSRSRDAICRLVGKGIGIGVVHRATKRKKKGR